MTSYQYIAKCYEGSVKQFNMLYQNVGLEPAVQGVNNVTLSSLLIETIRLLRMTGSNSAY